jgi:FMN reductase (NADPH)/FMN reductase [NAD(P)H]
MAIMNPTLDLLLQRRSIRAYQDRPVGDPEREAILAAAMRAPTAGNMMLYSVIHVRSQESKETLARTCDNQPFIARAPLVLLFLADYQRWHDYYRLSGVEQLPGVAGSPLKMPEEGDLFLACCDALIAAQTAVIAAESLGIGSCYIGDILENFEVHRDLFRLPRYTFPICLLCLGYPSQQQLERPLTTRFDEKFVVFEDVYRPLDGREYEEMFHRAQKELARSRPVPEGVENPGQMNYVRKFTAAFSQEMRRSVRAMLRAWEPEL